MFWFPGIGGLLARSLPVASPRGQGGRAALRWLTDFEEPLWRLEPPTIKAVMVARWTFSGWWTSITARCIGLP